MQQPLPDNERLNPWLSHQGMPDLGEDHKDLEQLLSTTAEFRVPAIRTQEEAWKMLQDRLPAESTHVKPMFNRRIWMAAAAIVLLFSVSFWWVNQSQPVTIESARAEHRTVNLPDGSTVVLNAESRVSFDKNKWDEDRSIHLDGEGFFEVKKGIPFRVTTAQGTVSVLGTSFNVYVRDEKLEVACFTGEVKVTNSEGLDEHLTPGKALEKEASSTENLRLFQVEIQKIGSWKKGKFYFDNEPLIDVIAVLERQYDVTVVFPGLENVPYYGWFTNQNLEQALKTICSPLGIQFQYTHEGHILLQQAANVDVEK